MERTDFIFGKNPLPRILVGTIMVFLWSCGPDSQKGSRENLEETGQIFIVLEDSLVRDFLRQRKAVLKYIDDGALPARIEFSDSSILQTQVINTEREALELVYRENGQPKYSYYIQRGDSVRLGIKEGKPWLKTANRQTTDYDNNLEVLRNRELYRSTYTKLEDFHFFWNSNFATVTPVELEDELKKSRREAIESLNAELSWIDSLKDEKLISGKTAAFYSVKARFELKKLQFYAEEDGMFNATGAFRSFLGSEWDNPDDLKSVYLDEFADFVLARKTLDGSSQQLTALATETGTPFGKLMLFKYLKQTLPLLSFEEAGEWLKRYADVLDPALTGYLKTRNDIMREQVPDMELMGLGKTFTTFQDMLFEKRGKYLYVDLWAAWCIPCIQSFPASLALQDEYGEKGIEVVYLSVDKNHKFWEEVVRKYDIAIPGRSFIAMNLAESKYLESLNLEFIPRYLLFDPNGNLIHQNAPRPESEEIRLLFEKHAGKNTVNSPQHQF